MFIEEGKKTIEMLPAALVEQEAGSALMQNVNEALQTVGMDETLADKADNFVVLLLIVAVALLANLICRKIILNTVSKLVKQTKATWDDIVFNDTVLSNVSRMVAPLLIYIAIPVAFPEHIDSALLDFFRRLCEIYILAVFLRFVSALFTAVYLVYSEKEQYKDKPLKGLLQTAQVILFFIGGIVIISILIEQSPVALLTGLGASAAVLMLVFKDSIMGFVSGIQLSANNMLKVGDWITMPKYGADGTVIEVTLNTVKVRNFDNTITTIPPYLLVSDSFQNWQGMQESGGRRVKRSVNIDMTSVCFCTPEMLEKFRKIQLLKAYIDEKEKALDAYNKELAIDDSVLVNGRRQTNLGVFRAYLTNYLKSLPAVNRDMTCMVRQLQPTETGLPLELYFFSADKVWVNYESIQADVFDHVLAIIPEFGLRVFQNPSGADLHRMGVKIEH
ncbi:mechanosensitive ion channel family protein [uncultured Bacteroides sp.]|uniref:mechanosensitive ion channel family protein n=1 Tax=uncultured Bacteroides sp. TaxID=162156 RepID=UPI0025DD4A69|nr:mechanosensitive ion channel domain-containing protein [uncultured Bacteroides sp.]